jgi:hypothetical protein
MARHLLLRTLSLALHYVRPATHIALHEKRATLLANDRKGEGEGVEDVHAFIFASTVFPVFRYA